MLGGELSSLEHRARYEQMKTCYLALTLTKDTVVFVHLHLFCPFLHVYLVSYFNLSIFHDRLSVSFNCACVLGHLVITYSYLLLSASIVHVF